MFPISSDVVFSMQCFDEGKLVQDLLPTSEANNLADQKKVVKKRPREVKENNEETTKSSKTAQRFLEKQRRKDMSALYASLRSLLPLEYVKGKRAISDHMQQAVIYINDLRNKIDELKMRRDELKKLIGHKGQSSSSCVEIKVFRDGLMEILISCSLEKESFPLSKVLAELLRRQLNVIDCVFTRGDRCCLHKIHIQHSAPTSIDLSELQKVLVDVIRLA